MPVIAANPVAEPDEWRLESAGLPVGDVELRVVDLESGDVVAAGETQERWRSGAPPPSAGYVPDDATAAAFDDGWYRTGDVGWLEAGGWVHLTDRCKEMIKVSGFQVAPAEIEAVLHAHPAVVDSAVFGVADERAGEVPVAAVQLAPGADVSPAGGTSSSSLRKRSPVTNGSTAWSSSKPCRGRRRARCCAARCRDEWAPRIGAGVHRERRLSGRPPLARTGGPPRRRRADGRTGLGPSDGGAAR